MRRVWKSSNESDVTWFNSIKSSCSLFKSWLSNFQFLCSCSLISFYLVDNWLSSVLDLLNLFLYTRSSMSLRSNLWNKLQNTTAMSHKKVKARTLKWSDYYHYSLYQKLSTGLCRSAVSKLYSIWTKQFYYNILFILLFISFYYVF